MTAGDRIARPLVVVALAFSGGLGLADLLLELLVGRFGGERALGRAGLVAAAGAGAALVAIGATRLARPRRASARFSLALLSLLALTPMFLAGLVFLVSFPYAVFGEDLPPVIYVFIAIDYAAASIYTVLSTVMRGLQLPLLLAAVALAWTATRLTSPAASPIAAGRSDREPMTRR